MSIALRSVGLPDVLASTPAEPSIASYIHARLRRLAMKSGEKCGLEGANYQPKCFIRSGVLR